MSEAEIHSNFLQNLCLLNLSPAAKLSIHWFGKPVVPLDETYLRTHATEKIVREEERYSTR